MARHFHDGRRGEEMDNENGEDGFQKQCYGIKEP